MESKTLHFAHYEVRQHLDGSAWELGRGAMGVTYKAYDSQLRVEVALKVINPAQLGEAKVQALFLREARAAARVHHSNVANVVFLNQDPANPFYAMEFIAGESLRDWMRTRIPLPPLLAIGLAEQIALGLEAIHAEHVIHRDLKPGNVMILRSPRGLEPGAEDSDPVAWQIKIIDFGLARTFAGDALGSNVEALTTGFRGTAVYASPEQCQERIDLDGRSDLYSLGCILWEMLLGAPPFRGSSLHEILTLHVSCPAPVEQLSRLPASLQTVVARLLVKDPDGRFPNAAAAATALARCRERTESGAEGGDEAGLASELETTVAPAIPGSSRSTGVPSSGSAAGAQTSRAFRIRVLLVVFGALLLGWIAMSAGGWRGSAPTVEKAPPPASAADPNSIAVLAFANLSDEKENEYFSDGISEELLTVLQKIPGLRVAARTSAFSFKGKNLKVQQIGQELGVANLVEGSVRKSGNSVRISAHLCRADTGEQVWSENYTRDLRDAFAVQSELAQTIVEQLRGRFSGGAADRAAKAQIRTEVRAAERGGTKNIETYQYYLQGQFLAKQISTDGITRAIVLFRKAVELDPGFALAWAALSSSLARQVSWDTTELSVEEGFREARQAADRALALEPNLAEAHLALAMVQLWHDFDWRGAESSVRRAVELAPSGSMGWGAAAEIENALGRLDGAIALSRQALALDPLNPEILMHHGWYLVNRDRLADAEKEFRRVIEINPTAISAKAALSVTMMLQGRLEEAAALAERETTPWARFWALALVRWAQGQRSESDEALRQLEEGHGDDMAIQIAEVRAYRSEMDQAFAWLERAFRQHDAGLPAIKTDRMFTSLRSDQRWADLLNRLGLLDDQRP